MANHSRLGSRLYGAQSPRNINIVCLGDSHTQGNNKTASQSVGATPSATERIGLLGLSSPLDKHWTGTADGDYFPANNCILTSSTGTQDPNLAGAGAGTMGSYSSLIPKLLRSSYALNTIRLANVGIGGSSAFTWAGEQAHAFFQCLGSAPSDGDTATVGGVTYTFRTSATLANEITIGTAAVSMQRLGNAINAESTGWGAGTVVNPNCFVPNVAAATSLHVFAKLSGTAGNSIAISATGGRVTTADKNLTPGATTLGYGSATSAIYTNALAKIPAGFGTVDVFCITLGTNDAARTGYRARGTQTELETLVANLHATYPSAQIVLWKPCYTGGGATATSAITTYVNPAVAAIAAANPSFVSYVDMWALGQGSGDVTLVDASDGTHMTSYGYSMLAQMMARKIATALNLT